jgi:hypothetical protein
MELDSRGIRIPHEQPLKTYLTEVPCKVPCELPDACAPVPPQPERQELQQPELLPDPPSTSSPISTGASLPRPSPQLRIPETPESEVDFAVPSEGPKLLPPPMEMPNAGV